MRAATAAEGFRDNRIGFKILYRFLKKENGLPQPLHGFAMTAKRKFIRTPYVFAITKRRVILNAKRERIRNPLERETDCHSRLRGFAMTDKRKFIRTPYVFVATKPLVILSAWRERIRNPFERETDCRSRLRGFAMTAKRKFIRTPYVFVATKPLVILSAKRERIRNILKRETDCRSRLHACAMTWECETAYRTPCGVCNDGVCGTNCRAHCGNAVLKQTAPERSFRSGAASIYPICCKAPLFGRQTPLYPCWLPDGIFL